INADAGSDAGGASDQDGSMSEEESGDDEPALPDEVNVEEARVSLDDQLRASQERLRDRLVDIFARYSQPFDGDDEIDLETMEIVQDRGFIRDINLDRFNSASILYTRTPRPPGEEDSESSEDPDHDDFVDSSDA